MYMIQIYIYICIYPYVHIDVAFIKFQSIPITYRGLNTDDPYCHIAHIGGPNDHRSLMAISHTLEGLMIIGVAILVSTMNISVLSE